MSKHENARSKAKPVTQAELAAYIKEVCGKLRTPKASPLKYLAYLLASGVDVEPGTLYVDRKPWGMELKEKGRSTPHVLFSTEDDAPVPVPPPEGYVRQGYSYRGMMEVRYKAGVRAVRG